MQEWMWWVVGGALLMFYMLRPSTPADANLSPAQVQDWMGAKNNLQLIDVRTPEEYAQGHLRGAVLLPLSTLNGRIKDLDAKRPLVLYCHSGRRSGQALRILLSSGFPEAKHLAGGLLAWQRAGLSVTR